MTGDEYAELRKLIEKTLSVAEQNHKMLKRIHRMGMIELILRIVWYGILIGLPFALYYYVLGPYFEAFGSSYEEFSNGMQQLPGIKAFGTIFGP